jgi:hypothetical protein
MKRDKRETKKRLRQSKPQKRKGRNSSELYSRQNKLAEQRKTSTPTPKENCNNRIYHNF